MLFGALNAECASKIAFMSTESTTWFLSVVDLVLANFLALENPFMTNRRVAAVGLNDVVNAIEDVC